MTSGPRFGDAIGTSDAQGWRTDNERRGYVGVVSRRKMQGRGSLPQRRIAYVRSSTSGSRGRRIASASRCVHRWFWRSRRLGRGRRSTPPEPTGHPLDASGVALPIAGIEHDQRYPGLCGVQRDDQVGQLGNGVSRPGPPRAVEKGGHGRVEAPADLDGDVHACEDQGSPAERLGQRGPRAGVEPATTRLRRPALCPLSYRGRDTPAAAWRWEWESNPHGFRPDRFRGGARHQSGGPTNVSST